MKEPIVQLSISRSGHSVWCVLVMPRPDGTEKRVRFGQNYSLVKNYINRIGGSVYLTFTLTKPKKLEVKVKQ